MKKWGPEDRCALRRLRKHWASLQAAPILSKICVSRTRFLKITSSHCQFACYRPNKKACDSLEKYLLRISSKINLWPKFLQFPANSMSCSCSVPPQGFALLCLSHIFPRWAGFGSSLIFSLILFACLWPGQGSGCGPDDLGFLLSGDLWSFCSPLTQINPLCLSRHILGLVKSVKICSWGGGGGRWWVLEPLSHLQKQWAEFIPGFNSVYQLLSLRSSIQREIRRVCACQ